MSEGGLLASGQYSRFIFRVTVITVCTLGCGYQVYSFLSLFFTYPSVVDVDIKYPEYVWAPAITICNHNGLKRRKICEAEEDFCIMSQRGEEFCEDPAHEELCQNRSFMSYYMIPDFDLLDREVSLTLEDLAKYGHKEDMLKECFVSWAPDYNPCKRENLVRTSIMCAFEIGRNCYVINSLSELPPSPMSKIPLQSNDVGTYLRMIIDFEPAEYFQTKRAVEGYIVVHSPYLIGNAYTMGFVIHPGQEYNLQLQVKETNLLPAPYQTNCTDYEAIWRANNFSGPLTQQSCIDQCMVDSAMEACNCFPAFIQKNLDKINASTASCIRAMEEDACVNTLDISHCAPSCAKECRYLSYDITLFESVFEDPPEDTSYYDPEFGLHNLGINEDDENAYNLPFQNMPTSYKNIFTRERYAKITIQLKKPELMVYVQKPKFEGIEVFSYVGSYLGMWLGLSLVTITDFLENFILRTFLPWYRVCTGKKAD